ncbi:MAG: sugar phosphate isomerase/epimerase [Clostridia bacterium]|nr:sugar phosphate isomerase/epimerase [Clostridia bacterium]
MDISVHCLKEECFPALKEIGFVGIDLSFDNKKAPEEMLSQAEKALDLGLKICQTHLWPPHFSGEKDDYEGFVEAVFPIYKRQIEATAKMGCHTAVMHPYGNADFDLAKKGTVLLIEKLLPTLQKTGVILSVENVYGENYSSVGFATAEDMLYITEHFNSKYVGICFDTGHAILLRQNVLEMLKKLSGHITALHLHTTLTVADMHSIPYSIKYHETIRWKEFYDILVEGGYKGTFNLEIKPPLEYSVPTRNAFFKMAYEASKDIIEKRF